MRLPIKQIKTTSIGHNAEMSMTICAILWGFRWVSQMCFWWWPHFKVRTNKSVSGTKAPERVGLASNEVTIRANWWSTRSCRNAA